MEAGETEQAIAALKNTPKIWPASLPKCLALQFVLI
jgi:hypothetical protein